MGLKNLHLKFKAFRLRQLLVYSRSKKRLSGTTPKPSWMVPISHGYHVIEDRSLGGGGDGGFEEKASDSVVVQREQIDEIEVWFFGVSDSRIGDGITKYMQSHFLDSKPKESQQIRRKSKEAMKKAYQGAKAKVREIEKAEEAWKVGSASAMVMNGEKLVLANMGEYRAVVCKDGVAHLISRKHRHTDKGSWTRRLISGAFHMPRVRMLACSSGITGDDDDRQPKSLSVVVGAERIDSDTEFIILASTGIWEVMKNQEAVNLIRHIEDPQEAAECLAKEALTRMSRSKISCLVIHFD